MSVRFRFVFRNALRRRNNHSRLPPRTTFFEKRGRGGVCGRPRGYMGPEDRRSDPNSRLRSDVARFFFCFLFFPSPACVLRMVLNLHAQARLAARLFLLFWGHNICFGHILLRRIVVANSSLLLLLLLLLLSLLSLLLSFFFLDVVVVRMLFIISIPSISLSSPRLPSFRRDGDA